MMPPSECRECGEYAESVFRHAEGCEVAQRIAQRELERLRENQGTVWETEDHAERIARLEDLIES